MAWEAACTCKWNGSEVGRAVLMLVVVKQTNCGSCWGGGWQHAHVGGVARREAGCTCRWSGAEGGSMHM